LCWEFGLNEIKDDLGSGTARETLPDFFLSGWVEDDEPGMEDDLLEEIDAALRVEQNTSNSVENNGGFSNKQSNQILLPFCTKLCTGVQSKYIQVVILLISV